MARTKDRSECRESVLFRSQGRCEANLGGMCTQRATDVHERLTRARGGSIYDPDNCVALCRPCHRYITDNPKWSDEEGWTLNSWS